MAILAQVGVEPALELLEKGEGGVAGVSYEPGRYGVEPADEKIVWLVDGKPVAKVGYPHTTRWPLRPSRHTIEARMVRRSEASLPVSVFVED